MTTIVAALRDAPWLGADRAKAWCRVLGGCGVVVAVALVAVTHGGVRADPWGQPLATDFSSFWSAAKLALAGVPGSAWDPAAHAAFQRAHFSPEAGFADGYYAFFYPPPFLLICLPLGLLPYGAALAVWLLVTGAGYVVAMRGLLPRHWPWALIALGFPGLLLNAEHGQNGALSAALFGMAALWLDRRPGLAGICLGALCFKPQLVVLVVPALVLAGRWRALAWAAGTAWAMCVGSLLVFGVAAWEGFVANSHLAGTALEMGLVGFGKMASVFAGVRLLGGPVVAAWAVQAVVSLVAVGAVGMVARRRAGGAAEVATVAVAACLATPFLLDYDLMLLAVPLAWVVAAAERDGFLPWEKLVLGAAFLLPLVARAVGMTVGVPVAPLVVLGLLAVVVRRACGWRAVLGWTLPQELSRLGVNRGGVRAGMSSSLNAENAERGAECSEKNL
jgi:alpha-1,2-mannosyltransferase